MKKILFYTILTSAIFTACSGSANDSSKDTNVNSNIENITVLPSTFKANDARLLTSQCAQCHGSDGISKSDWDSIAGEDEFAKEDFKKHPIMKAQADGYTLSEKRLIDGFLATLAKDKKDDEHDEDDD